MNRLELVEAVMKQADLPKSQVEKALAAITHSIVKAVSKGDSVTLVGFGTFSQRERAARKGRNPKTGEPIKIAKAKTPGFKAGATFKAVVNGKAKLPDNKKPAAKAKPAAKPAAKAAAKPAAKAAAKKPATKK